MMVVGDILEERNPDVGLQYREVRKGVVLRRLCMKILRYLGLRLNSLALGEGISLEVS